MVNIFVFKCSPRTWILVYLYILSLLQIAYLLGPLLVSEESTEVCLSLPGPLSITLSPNSVDLKLLLIL